MKKIFVTLIVMATVLLTTAQTKKTELFDLIKNYLPEASVTKNVLDWTYGKDAGGAVKWQSVNPKSYGSNVVKTGLASILISGKPLTCIDEISEKKRACKWQISLNGTKSGYSSFTISTDNFPESDPEKFLKILFADNSSAFTLYKKCVEGAMMWSRALKMSIPGKKQVWLVMEKESLAGTAMQYESSGVSNNFRLTVYFEKKEVDTICQY